MERVLVIGPCGAGKSTLARRLAPRLGLPLVHMDQLNWKPGWVDSDKAELTRKVEAAVAAPRWLIDGTYGGTLGPRLARATHILYLDFPVTLCLWRVLKRIARLRGQVRPDMSEGCPERFDLHFLLYLAGWNFGPRPRTEAKLAGHEAKLIRLRSPRALARWLASLEDR